MPKILIADQHSPYRIGLRAILAAEFEGLEVLEAGSYDLAVELLEVNTDTDLVLMDLDMPGILSFENSRASRERFPGVRFAILSASDASSAILRSLAAGLSGFISKSQPDDEILAAIHDILSGRIYVTPLLKTVAEQRTTPGTLIHPGSATPGAVELLKLTPRQRDLLPLLAKGLSNKEIARALNIADATAKIHAGAVLRILGARNRTEAALLARDYLANPPG